MYTKKGDKGTTSPGRRPTGSQTTPRLEAYGRGRTDVLYRLPARQSGRHAPPIALQDDLLAVLDHLMRAASHLATEGEAPKYLPEFGPEKRCFSKTGSTPCSLRCRRSRNSRCPADTGPYRCATFAATICRRTERIVLTLSEQYTVNEYIRQYINRLSDYFYVLGRRLTEDFNVKKYSGCTINEFFLILQTKIEYITKNSYDHVLDIRIGVETGRCPWPATKDELIDYATRSGARWKSSKISKRSRTKARSTKSIEDIWPDYPSKDDFFFNEEEY